MNTIQLYELPLLANKTQRTNNSDCINETFRVLKDNEQRKYGEYRTKRLVLEARKRFGYGK